MAIVVIGGGAIGLLVAGRLAQASEPVALLARASGVAALNAGGLTLTEDGRSSRIDALPAAALPEALPSDCQAPALAILCVKGYDTQSTLSAIDSLAPQHVLTLQNGIGNEEILAKHLGAAHVLSGIITSSVAVKATSADGGLHIEITKAGGIGLAPLSTTPGADDQRPVVAQWAAVLRRAGFATQQYDDYRTLKWSKALLNMLGNGTAAVLDLPPEVIYTDRRLFALELRLIKEALAVMNKRQIMATNLPRYPAALLSRAVRWLPAPVLQPILKRAIAGGRGGKLPSLLGDLQRGRDRSEGEFLYGAIAAAARESGVSAPTNQALWNALEGIATGNIDWSQFRHKPEALLTWVRAARST